MKVDRLVRRSDKAPLQQQERADQPLVIIIDDDLSVREALSDLLLSAGLHAISFASPTALTEAGDVLDRPGCIILDVRMPGTSGLDLQNRLLRDGNSKPIIFLTGHGDIPMTVQAMKAGAVDFLTKPVRDQTLIDAVIAALELDATRRRITALVSKNINCFNCLTPREREVFGRIAIGRVNKQIAFDLGISEVTVKLHRSNVMRKMQVASIGELIRAWEVLPISLRGTASG